MDSAVRKKAIEAIYQAFGGDVHRVNLPGILDALTIAGLQIIDTQTHWAAPNEATENMIFDCDILICNEGLLATPSELYAAMRDAAK